ncbi:amino acid ABC transporter permease [Acetobacter persici]|uniref:amino acid ABC transporter permease n=1 Tax=Acetobacter persici TaxID=1076596 RepID=UPI001BA49C59|nr:amino acid ABC transporter permease [Acetobacter persici]MBS0964026.1 amino acid ABC transporter permease [Acetobacter persici]
MRHTWDFSFLVHYLLPLGRGLMNTICLSGVVMVAGFTLGLLAAIASMSPLRTVRMASAAYVELLRNVPALVILFLFFYVIPALTGFQNDRFLTACVAFSLYTSAYFCEILRGGFLMVDPGQWESGYALGLSRAGIFCWIIAPQIIRAAMPSLANEAIEIVKISTVASTIAFPEFLYQTKIVSDIEYRPIETYTASAIVITVLILTLTWISRIAARHFAGHRRKEIE